MPFDPARLEALTRAFESLAEAQDDVDGAGQVSAQRLVTEHGVVEHVGEGQHRVVCRQVLAHEGGEVADSLRTVIAQENEGAPLGGGGFVSGLQRRDARERVRADEETQDVVGVLHTASIYPRYVTWGYRIVIGRARSLFDSGTEPEQTFST